MNTRDVNAKIIAAINDNPLLSKLLIAKDGAGDSLIVESLIDGAMTGGDLVVGLTNGTWNATGTAAYTTQQALLNDGANTPVAGNNTGTTSHNWVNGGAGDDVIVLNVNGSTGADRADGFHDVLVLESNFGNDTVLNFETGIDQINLSSLVYTDRALSNAGLRTAGTVNTAYVENGSRADVNTPANNPYTVADFLTQYGTANNVTANAKGVVFWANDINAAGSVLYTVFHVQNNNDTTLQASEVSVIGTIRLEGGSDGIEHLIANGDLTI